MDKTRALETAREWLRNEQMAAVSRSAFEYKGEDGRNTELALNYLDTYYATQPTDDPERVTRGPFSYRASNETKRLSKAREITNRVQPGSFEDPNYFALLGFQFATAQLAFDGTLEGPFKPDRLRNVASRIIFGTVASPEINAFANKQSLDGYYVIGLTAGIVDFVYQAARAVVAATSPRRGDDGKAAVTASGDIEAVISGLGPSDESVERLYRTLEAYFYKGYPRVSGYEAIPFEHGPVLATIVPMAERWIIAHEFGHVLAAAEEIDFFDSPENPFRAEEFFADNTATILTALSAMDFDGLPPDFSLAGGDFALACLEIQDRAFGIVTTGEEPSDLGGRHHPPPGQRAINNLSIFRQFFDTGGEGKSDYELTFVMREREPENHPFGTGSVHEYRVTYLRQVLFALWPYVRERLKKAYKAGRPLHPMWTAKG